MNLRLASFFVGCIFLCSCSTPEETEPVSDPVVEEPQVGKADTSALYALVNPFIGTGGHGHTYPGVSMPFGMVQLSPDTRLDGWDGCSGYHYTDNVVFGFSHTHLSGTGVSDYGDILIMPQSGKPAERTSGTFRDSIFASSFSKENEHAEAGYYRTHLDDENISVELTATERVGVHKYTWQDDGEKWVVVDLKHRDMVVDADMSSDRKTQLSGYRISKAWAQEQHVYFNMQFSLPIEEVIYVETTDKKQNHLAYIRLGGEGNQLITKVGISPVDEAGAKKNLEAEVPGWNFEAVHQQAQQKWNKELQKVVVTGGTANDQTIFYSALYHSFLNPNLFSDVDGRYRGMDRKVYHSNYPIYTVFSLWDTFRGTHPLFTITQQQKTREFIYTLYNQYLEGGELPIWELAGNYTGCMIGYHSIPVISDAYFKGLVPKEDLEKLYVAMKHSAMQDKLGLASYKENGFIAAGDEAESVSKTLEYAYDDWCIAQIAMVLEKEEDALYFIKRARSYKNLYDPHTGFLRAKMNGSWFTPFDPAEVNFNYTEANAWQYSLFAPQDIGGLIELMGGREPFEEHLDNLYNASSATSGREQADITGLIGQYAHGNEPSHHMAYLYNYIGKPWKTQDMVQRIMKEMYANAPDGLSGNEDCGQMSSWYVLSAMGFYPVNPSTPYYNTGVPHFSEIELNLENGNTFTIKTEGEGETVNRITLDGEEAHLTILAHADIMRGGTLVFEKGSIEEARETVSGLGVLYHPIPSGDFTPVPFFRASGVTFTDNLSVSLGHAEDSTKIYYRIVSGEGNTDFAAYIGNPIPLQATTTIEAYATNQFGARSKSVQETYYKIKGGRVITLQTEYANQYSAGGDNALIDFIRGNENYRTGQWQGFQENDVVAIVDLGKKEQINSISLGVLQDIKSWIFYPPKVEFYTSEDGKTWSEPIVVHNTFSDTTYGGFTQNLTASMDVQAQYVKVIAYNYGLCPEWHLGAGGKSWIFADEIVIE